MATTYEVIYLGNLSLIDGTQNNEVAENAAGILGAYGSSGDPLSAHVQTLSAENLTEDDPNSYDINNDAGYDAFRINGGAPQNFDAVAIYNATITYADGTTATVVFQDVSGNTYLAPQTTANADQAALTAKPIMSMSLDSVASNTGDMEADRFAGDFMSSVDGTAGNDSMGLGYTDADGDQVTTGNDYINAGDGDDTIFGDLGQDTIYGGAGDDSIDGGADADLIYAGAGDDTIDIGNHFDTVYAGDGSDYIVTYGSNFGKLVFGGEGGTDQDTLSWATETDLADAVNVTFSEGEAGSALIRGQTVTFSEIENIEGTQVADVIDASASSADLGLSGEGGDDTIIGGAGDDTISGGAGADSLSGGDGSDRFVLQDGFGNDTIVGGEGGTDFDIIDLSQLTSAVTITFSGAEQGTLSDGTDTITFSQIEAFALPNGETVTSGIAGDILYVGDSGANGAGGGAGNDTVSGSDGNDSLGGGSGNDLIYGDDGDDDIGGDAGDDTIHGGAGDDAIGGGEGNDLIYGGDGSDSIGGNSGNDTIFGGAGDDIIGGGDDDDLIYGGDGNDSLSGNDGNDTVYGGAGDDTLHSSSGNDSVSGGDDADLFKIFDGFGNDTLVGGEGGTDSDTIDLSNLTGPVTVTYTSDEAGTITDGTDTITFSEIERLILTDYDDVIWAEDDGVDTYIDGGAGNDFFDAGEGNDTFVGGLGDDSIKISHWDGSMTFLGGDGTDSIAWSASGSEGVDAVLDGDGSGTFNYVTGGDGAFSDVESFDLTFMADSFDGTASTTGLEIFGMGGANTIDGGSGDDTIYGGYGDDIIVANDGNDTVLGADGHDTIYGGAGDDVILGGGGNDVLDGGSGDDILTGGGGNDIFVRSDGNDTITDFNTGNSGALNDGDTTNNDFVDLSAFYTNIFELRADFDDDGILNQSDGDYSDNTSMSGGSLTFTGANRNSFTTDNTGVVCFAAGTAIRTPRGDVAVEDLRPGDLVCTWNGAPQPLVWVGYSELSLQPGMVDPGITPVRIKPWHGHKYRALIVSPQHCMLMRLADDTTAFVRARHLAEETELASFARGKSAISYHHLFLARHQILIAAGRPSESFYPGLSALKLMAEPERDSLLRAAPSLRSADPRAACGPRAAKVLSRQEVRTMAVSGQLEFAETLRRHPV